MADLPAALSFVLMLMFFIFVVIPLANDIRKKSKYSKGIVCGVNLREMPELSTYKDKQDWVKEQNPKLTKRQITTILAKWDEVKDNHN